jgi:hypothetical protein
MATLAGAITLVLVSCAVVLAASSRSGKALAAQSDVVRRAPFDGLGSWVDMYSWSQTFSAGGPHFGLADVDAMATAGVQTLFIQAASQTGPATVLEPDRLRPLIVRARQAGMSVVVWYMPTLVNLADDLTRLQEIARLPADGVAVDIESTAVSDIAARNAALVALSRQLRRLLPHFPLGAITLPATLLEVVNPKYWPAFPYTDLAASYDAWLPMVYWTDRLASSGLRDGYRYTADSIGRLRRDLGPVAGPAARIDPIGGVSVDGLAAGDLAGFVQAAREGHSSGGSLYEWPGTAPEAWGILRPLRS